MAVGPVGEADAGEAHSRVRPQKHRIHKHCKWQLKMLLQNVTGLNYSRLYLVTRLGSFPGFGSFKSVCAVEASGPQASTSTATQLIMSQLHRTFPKGKGSTGAWCLMSTAVSGVWWNKSVQLNKKVDMLNSRWMHTLAEKQSSPRKQNVEHGFRPQEASM